MFHAFVTRKLSPSAVKPSFANECFLLSSFRSKRPIRRAICSEVEPALPARGNASLTVSYLIGSCGLPPSSAVSAAKFVNLKSTRNADSVLQLLKAYSLSDAEITKMISKCPRLLSCNLEKNLKPKLEFLYGAGFKNEQLAKILVGNPSLFWRSLKNFIMPTVVFLKSKPHSVPRIASVLKSNGGVFWKRLEFLRSNDISDFAIARMLAYQPRALNFSICRLKEAINTVKEMGLDPKSKKFGTAVAVLTHMSKSTWLRKLELYRGLGWSDEEIFLVFCKQPVCLALSSDSILKKLEFYRKSMGWERTMFVKFPMLLMFSLEKRIIPRVSVLNKLTSRGVIKNGRCVWKITMGDKRFFNQYVKMYTDVIPELTDAYRLALPQRC